MLRSLRYSVTFPDTGRTLSADLTFDQGFTAITGSNEAGKTMILEMCRYLLFGTQALRGIADDYKTLKVEGEFSIRGVDYACERTIKTAVLRRGDEIVATGTTTVNEKIFQLLGFGLSIFDVANSINQGDVERLGSMTAGERKKLVDGVLGIDALDVVAKWGMEEARVMDKEADAIRRTLQVPVPPIEPDGYRPSSEIDLEQLRADARELAELVGWLSHTKTAPLEPISPCDQTVSELEPLAEQRQALRTRIETYKAKVAALPEAAPYTTAELRKAEQQWNQFDEYQTANTWLRDNPKPDYQHMQLIVFIDDWTALGNKLERAGLMSRIEKLKAAGSRPCPHCGEDVPLEQETIERLQEQHDALPVADVPTPPIGKDECFRQLELVRRFDLVAYNQMLEVKQVDRPVIERLKLSVYRAMIDQVHEREAWAGNLKNEEPVFEAMPDYETLLLQRRAYEASLVRYTQESEAFDAWVAERDAKAVRAQELGRADAALYEAQDAHAAAIRYEEATERFKASTSLYDAGVEQAEGLEAAAQQHRKVRELMSVLRSLIKQHLMPSLNKVASHLLNGMTGGQRSAVVVDENFDVIVDGQRLETLSGSGKACANLAIRIALGQVLTHRVFSVLLADEIDASMDEFRAGNTSKVLDTLSNSISQILLVSHKNIEADQLIQLGASIEFGQGAATAL